MQENTNPKNQIYQNLNNEYTYANEIIQHRDLDKQKYLNNYSNPLQQALYTSSPKPVIRIQPEFTPPGKYIITSNNYEIIYNAFRQELLSFLNIVTSVRNKEYREYLQKYYENPNAYDIARQSLINTFARIFNIKDLVKITDDNYNLEFLKNYLKLNDLQENVNDKNTPWFHIYWKILHYSSILVTTPAPTVLPPSRIAKRSPCSTATGVINSISRLALSPGMTISTPLGNFAIPVTSIVRT